MLSRYVLAGLLAGRLAVSCRLCGAVADLPRIGDVPEADHSQTCPLRLRSRREDN
jgi:hypothetical protein